jgi:hypothetical protein
MTRVTSCGAWLLLLAALAAHPAEAAAQGRVERLRQRAQSVVDQAAERLNVRAAPASADASETDPTTETVVDRMLEARSLARSLVGDSLEVPESPFTASGERQLLRLLVGRAAGASADGSLFDTLRAREAERERRTGSRVSLHGRGPGANASRGSTGGSFRVAFAGMVRRIVPSDPFPSPGPHILASRASLLATMGTRDAMPARRGALRNRSSPARRGAVEPDPDHRVVRETTERKEIDGIQVTVYTRETVWKEKGKVGQEILARSTTETASDGRVGTKVEEMLMFAEVKYCPDPAGIASGVARSVSTQSYTLLDPATHHHSRVHYAYETSGGMRATVDRRAELRSIDMETQTEASIHMAAGGRSSVMNARLPARQSMAGDRLAQLSFSPLQFDLKDLETSVRDGSSRKAGEMAVATAHSGNTMVQLSTGAVYREARDAWRGGDCIEVVVLEGQGKELEPGEQATVRARTRHREDGGAEDRPIDTRPWGGSITPDGEVRSEATWTYTAEEQGGGILLESVSERGIGSATVSFGKPAGRLRITIVSESSPVCRSPYTATWDGTMTPIGKDRYRVRFKHVTETAAGCGTFTGPGRKEWNRCWTRGELDVEGEMQVWSNPGMKAGMLSLRPVSEYRGDWTCDAPKTPFPGYFFKQLPIMFPPGDKGKMLLQEGDGSRTWVEFY